MQEAGVAPENVGRQCREPLTMTAENFSQVTKTSVSLPTAAAGWEGGFCYPRKELPCPGTHAYSQLPITLTPSNPRAPLTPLGQQQECRWALRHGLELLLVSSTPCTISEQFLPKLIPSFLRSELKEQEMH